MSARRKRNRRNKSTHAKIAQLNSHLDRYERNINQLHLRIGELMTEIHELRHSKPAHIKAMEAALLEQMKLQGPPPIVMQVTQAEHNRIVTEFGTRNHAAHK